MTCKDCFHYEVCKTYEEFDFANHSKCDTYKDKSKVIELPCKVGDMVYILDYEDDTVVDYSGFIFIMANNDFAFLSPILNNEDNPVEICNEYFEGYINMESNSGVIVLLSEILLTREEAEAMLKELQNDVK